MVIFNKTIWQNYTLSVPYCNKRLDFYRRPCILIQLNFTHLKNPLFVQEVFKEGLLNEKPFEMMLPYNNTAVVKKKLIKI